MPSEFMDILRGYGLAGLVMLVLGWAVRSLYNRNQELHDTLNEVGREAVKANEQTANALNKMAEVNSATNSSVQKLDANVQRLLWKHGVSAEAGE